VLVRYDFVLGSANNVKSVSESVNNVMSVSGIVKNVITST